MNEEKSDDDIEEDIIKEIKEIEEGKFPEEAEEDAKELPHSEKKDLLKIKVFIIIGIIIFAIFIILVFGKY